MPIYDNESFKRDLIPTYLKKEVRDVIETAVMFGWKMHISGSNSVTIVSPDERKKYHFSASGRSNTSINRIKKDVVRYGDPEKLQIADSILGIKDKSIATAAMALLPHLGDEETIVDHRPDIEAEAKEKQRKKEEEAREYARSLTKKQAPAPTPKEMPQKKAEALVAKEGRTITSEKPMVAKASDGLGYQSRVAIERTWSDGTVDYKCVKCDYSSENRLSIRSHWPKHANGKGEPPPRFKTDVPNAASYKPRKERIDALAAIIQAIMDGGEMSPHAIAMSALTWVHEQSRKGTVLAEEREPLGPEDILSRIRSLLDDGTQIEAMREQAEAIDALQGEVEIYKAEMEKAQEQALHAEERADKARQTLNTFIELASELGNEEARGA